MANHAIDRFVRQVRRISLLCGFVAAALIAAGVIIVCDMVFVRYVLNLNTIWKTDFVTYCLVAATFIGSPFVLMTRGHVNVDVIPHYMGPQKRRWLALFASALTLAFCVVIALLTSLFWKEAWDNKWVSDTIWRARLWIPYASMPIGLGLLTLQSIADLLALVTRREPPFGISKERDA
jgi:TRAP-type C4-dicarboxylate transport system permease small subunit